MRMLLLAGLAGVFALPQSIVDRTFLIRADTTTFDPYSGMTHVCVLVFPDGKYRLEHSFQGNEGSNPVETRIYLSQLPDAHVKQLQSILDSPDFQAITTPERHGGIVQNLETLSVLVPREHSVQNISFENADQRKPYAKTLKSFFDWMKQVEKLKAPVAKQETATNCAPPRVMYRSTISPKPRAKDESDSADEP